MQIAGLSEFFPLEQPWELPQPEVFFPHPDNANAKEKNMMQIIRARIRCFIYPPVFVTVMLF